MVLAGAVVAASSLAIAWWIGWRSVGTSGAWRTALRDGVPASIRGLVAAGIDPNASVTLDPADGPVLPLHDAIEQHDRAMVAELLQSGADPNLAIDRGGFTAVHIAVGSTQCTLIETLAEYGADLDREGGARTPLMYAIDRRDAACVAELLRLGARVDVRDPNGETAMDWAIAVNDTGLAAMLRDHGAKITQDHLFNASRRSYADMVTWCVSEGGLDPLRREHGTSALLEAAQSQWRGAASVKQLLEWGADVNEVYVVEGVQGTRALHVAAMVGTLDTVRALIDAGADVNAARADGRTALDLARYRRDKDGAEIAEFLSARSESGE
ncbi:MAG: ankyrin repeat domain-containing protein [Phycisphaerales bacterium]|nr:ankyrin repeat domain-containing protein [Phycisphaerales bacterium]